MYDIVDDDDIHGKRYIDVGRLEGVLMRAHVPMLLLTSRATGNISLNGTSGRRSRRAVVRKHRGSGEVWKHFVWCDLEVFTATPGEST